MRFSPNVTGPIPNPTRSLKTGSVTTVTPSIFISTVLCPIHAAWSPVSGHFFGSGLCAAGTITRSRSC